QVDRSLVRNHAGADRASWCLRWLPRRRGQRRAIAMSRCSRPPQVTGADEVAARLGRGGWREAGGEGVAATVVVERAMLGVSARSPWRVRVMDCQRLACWGATHGT